VNKKATKKLSVKRGRPKYVPSKPHLNAVYKLAQKGCNYSEIAKGLKIALDTFRINLNTVIDKNNEDFTCFLDAIKKARAETDPERLEQAENAFFKRVIGFDYDEVHNEEHTDAEGGVSYKTKTIRKKVLADVTACIFYLVNRNPNKWKSINQTILQVSENTDEHYRKIADALVQLDNNSEKVQE